MRFPESTSPPGKPRRGVLAMPKPGVIVFAGKRDVALQQAQRLWTASYEPELGTPLYAPCPVFTVLPQLPAGKAAVSTLRAHHDDVIRPALEAGRSVFCVGAWWREPAIQALTGGFALEVLAAVWPTEARVITVDFEPASPRPQSIDYLSPDHVRMRGISPGQLTADLGGAPYTLGQIDWPRAASRTKRTRK